MKPFVKTGLISFYFSVGLMTSSHIGYMCGASLGENNPNSNKFINRSFFSGLFWPIFFTSIAYDVLKDNADD